MCLLIFLVFTFLRSMKNSNNIGSFSLKLIVALLDFSLFVVLISRLNRITLS